MPEPDLTASFQEPQGTGGTLKTWRHRLLLSAAAYNIPEFVKECSKSELNGSEISSALLIWNVFFFAVLWTVSFDYLAGGSFHPVIAVASLMVSGALGVCDHLVFYRSQQFPLGLRALQDAGLKLDVPSAFTSSSKLARRARIGLSIVTAALTAIVTGLALERSAIEAEQQAEWLAINHQSADRARDDFAGMLGRAKDAYNAELEIAKQITSAHDLDVQRAMRAARRSTHAVSPLQRADVQASEKSVSEENAKVAGLKKAVDDLSASRPAFMNRAIEADPESVPKSTSLISQVSALFRILWADPWAAIVVFLVDAAIFGADLLPLTVKAIHMPSTYNELIARMHLKSMFEQARLTAAGLKMPPAKPRKKKRRDPNGVTPRRRRGRPTNAEVAARALGNGHAQER